MRNAFLALLATMLLVTASAWAADPLLGPHDVNNEGCMACHVPHNALPGKGLYLWAEGIPTGAYNTYLTATNQGGTGALQANISNLQQGLDTAGGTILCLSCHDTAFSGASMASGVTVAPSFNYGAGTLTWSGGYNKAIGVNGDLTHDHPVHVQYPASDRTYWRITVTPTPNMALNAVAFDDATYAYGHPTMLFSADGVNAYVECATCHNPHSQTQTVQKINGTAMNVKTAKFLRGAYETGADQTNFCMSCHAMPADAWTGNN